MTTSLKDRFSKFHNDEEGLEALQVVMIIAIAGLLMIAASAVGEKAAKWMADKWKALKGADTKIKITAA